MKVFAVYSNITFDPEPSWLDGFRKKYDEPYDLHATLKQPCYIDEGDILDIQEKLLSMVRSLNIENHQINISFNTLQASMVENEGMCMMLNSNDNSNPIYDIQKQIITALAHYKNYRKPQSQQWEQEFKPHITIGRKLDPMKYQAATRDLPHDYSCKAKLSDIVLTVVDNYNADEANSPKNLTVYKL